MKLVFFFLCCLPICAADFAVLTSGARIRADRIERHGDIYILHSTDSHIELSASFVETVEHIDDPVPPPPPPPPPPPEPDPQPQLTPRQMVTEAALRYGLPPAIVHAVAMTESAYQQRAVSPKGAIGVMQLMPSTAHALNADAKDLAQNIDAGTRLLKDLLLKYEGDPLQVSRALAAYNAGTGAVERYNGVPPYRETQAYVQTVIQRYWQAQKTGQ